MKKNNHALTVLLFAMLSICFSCKKNSTSSSTTSVEYQIIPMNVYFTKTTYTDNTVNAVVITDPSQFANGIKSISVSTKPFNANL